MLMQLLLDCLQDQSSTTKRCATLDTIAALIRSTGNAIKPFHSHPKLFTQLLTIVKSEPSQEVRVASYRLFGFIGALDPFSLPQVLSSLHLFCFH